MRLAQHRASDILKNKEQYQINVFRKRGDIYFYRDTIIIANVCSDLKQSFAVPA
jgi:hypothetical protein